MSSPPTTPTTKKRQRASGVAALVERFEAARRNSQLADTITDAHVYEHGGAVRDLVDKFNDLARSSPDCERLDFSPSKRAAALALTTARALEALNTAEARNDINVSETTAPPPAPATLDETEELQSTEERASTSLVVNAVVAALNKLAVNTTDCPAADSSVNSKTVVSSLDSSECFDIESSNNSPFDDPHAIASNYQTPNDDGALVTINATDADADECNPESVDDEDVAAITYAEPASLDANAACAAQHVPSCSSECCDTRNDDSELYVIVSANDDDDVDAEQLNPESVDGCDDEDVAMHWHSECYDNNDDDGDGNDIDAMSMGYDTVSTCDETASIRSRMSSFEDHYGSGSFDDNDCLSDAASDYRPRQYESPLPTSNTAVESTLEAELSTAAVAQQSLPSRIPIRNGSTLGRQRTAPTTLQLEPQTVPLASTTKVIPHAITTTATRIDNNECPSTASSQIQPVADAVRITCRVAASTPTPSPTTPTAAKPTTRPRTPPATRVTSPPPIRQRKRCEPTTPRTPVARPICSRHAHAVATTTSSPPCKHADARRVPRSKAMSMDEAPRMRALALFETPRSDGASRPTASISSSSSSSSNQQRTKSTTAIRQQPPSSACRLQCAL